MYPCPHTTQLPPYEHLTPNDTFVTISEPTLRHHNHQKSTDSTKVHS